jgi:hypothetical protein
VAIKPNVFAYFHTFPRKFIRNNLKLHSTQNKTMTKKLLCEVMEVKTAKNGKVIYITLHAIYRQTHFAATKLSQKYEEICIQVNFFIKTTSGYSFLMEVE